jgi:hypothetical protein
MRLETGVLHLLDAFAGTAEMTARDWLSAIIGAAALFVALFGWQFIAWGMGL